MPERYEVGLIDIELVTKENSPSRLNHITTGQHEKPKTDFTKARSLSYKVTLGQRLLFGSNPGGDDHVEVLRIMIHLVGEDRPWIY